MLDLITNPDKFFRENDDVPMLFAVSVVIVVAILSSLLVYMNMDLLLEQLKAKLSGLSEEQVKAFLEIMKVNMILSPALGAIIGWVITAGLIHIFSFLFGGEGEFSKTLKLTALGYVPSIVLFPVNFAIIEMTHKFAGTPVMIVGIASTIWQFVILTFGVKNWRNIETFKSALSVLIPLSIFMVLGFLGKMLGRFK